MIDEIPKQYNPKETEDKWYKFWEEKGLFSAKLNPGKKPFVISIPPPNVTGILHMGHALNNTIQDILIRYHRMKGFETLWMPGTDHAGIATQNVVEKSIAKEGLKRQDLGRERFIERVWDWREQYGATIIHQLKKLGASCDWERLRFTMDSKYSDAVLNAFIKLHKKGFIYRGSYIINWCPRCLTALSDEEAAHQPLKGSLYYLRYPICAAETSKDDQALNHSGYLVVATTRPETMLGDTAVAVNPKDKRFKNLIGKTVILPLINRKIKIIADNMVDMEFGTGAVKVTPAHDPNDYALGKKHGLEFITVMHPDGKMNESAGRYKGLDRFEARKAIINDLEGMGLLEKIEPHELSAGHCYRCHTIVEPYLSKQWFVKMKPLAKPAIDAVKKSKIKFYPNRWTKVYLNWMENIQDWCISRQIWWGHRLPVYYCKNCDIEAIVSEAKPEKCPKCGSKNIYQDEDVLDTWFSSWLWPFATLGWPQEKAKFFWGVPKNDLAYFYPTSSLVTAPEIIFFWVARMIMAGLEFQGNIPFKDVYIHGTVRDAHGKKMSKSLGNSIDPLEIINEYGTDALRFSLISITAQGQDVFLSKDRFEQGRNFANKIWNASRFILTNLEEEKINSDLCVFFQKGNLNPVNRWILSSFYSSLEEVEKYLKNYQFNEAANTLYSFFWHKFCDWYLEIVKPEIKDSANQLVMYKILEKFLRAIHPFMPFISEEIWHKLPRQNDSIMASSWPHIQKQIIDKNAENEMETIFSIITTIRNMRSELDIPIQSTDISVKISVQNTLKRELIKNNSPHIKELSRIKNLAIEERYSQSSGEFVNILKDMHIILPLYGVIDIDKYRAKLENKILKLETEIRLKEARLTNQDFVKKAPAEIIGAEKEKLKALTEEVKKLKGVKDGISS